MRHEQIFFDLDDTLVNTRQTILKRISLLLDKHSFNVTPEYVYELLGDSEREAKLSKKIGGKTQFWWDYESLRKEIHVNAIAGANTLLESLASEGKKMGIITNNTCSKTLIKLQSAKINPSFFEGNIHSCAEQNCLKSSPKIISHLQIDPEKTLYIGDDLIDYEFAVNSRIDFYGVCTGKYLRKDFNRRGLSNSKIFRSIKEII